MKITQFDKTNLTALRLAINAALAKVGADFDIKLEVGTISYRGTCCSIKVDGGVDGGVIAADGETETAEKATFRRQATLYGLRPEDLGREFIFGGHTYRVVGLNSRAQSMPILAERTDNGKTYKFAQDTVRLHLAVATG